MNAQEFTLLYSDFNWNEHDGINHMQHGGAGKVVRTSCFPYGERPKLTLRNPANHRINGYVGKDIHYAQVDR